MTAALNTFATRENALMPSSLPPRGTACADGTASDSQTKTSLTRMLPLDVISYR